MPWRSLRRQPAFARSPSARWRSASAPTPPSSAWSTPCCCGRSTIRSRNGLWPLNNLWRKTGVRGSVSAPDFHDWHDTASSFDAMAYYAGGETSVSVTGAADYGTAIRVTPGFFNVFGVGAGDGPRARAGGRNAGSPFTAVISHDFWMRRFGGRPDALGATVSFGERTFTIVGVMPPGFDFPTRTDIWYPAWVQPETTSRGAHNYRVVARLKDGVGARAGAGGDDGAGGAARTGVSGLQRRQRRRRRAAAGTAGRRHAADAEPARGRRRAGAAHRLRQRRQSPARARDRADERAGRPRRARRRAGGGWSRSW